MHDELTVCGAGSRDRTRKVQLGDEEQRDVARTRWEAEPAVCVTRTEAIADDARAAGAASLAAGVIATRERSLAFRVREGFTTEVVRLERRM